MQARTALTALAALLLLLSVAPYAPPSDPSLEAQAHDRGMAPEVDVDREGPANGEADGWPQAVDAVEAVAALLAEQATRDQHTQRVRVRGVRASRGDRGQTAPAADVRATRGGNERATHDEEEPTTGGDEDPSDDGERDADATGEEGDDHLAPQGDPEVVYGYAIEVRGEVGADVDAFARTTARILSDARGWSLGGSVAFEPDADEPDFTVVLASPDDVAATHEVCSPEYSCRVDDEIVVNDRNWREATSAWWQAGGDLATYRRYLINHEVGHFLGFGHVDCDGAGDPAPVMQQQSVSVQECEPSGWPRAWERTELAEQLDVGVRD